MSVERLRRIPVFGLSSPWVIRLDYRLLVVVVLLALALMLELCRSRSSGLHNLYIHSFSIIGVPWFLL